MWCVFFNFRVIKCLKYYPERGQFRTFSSFSLRACSDLPWLSMIKPGSNITSGPNRVAVGAIYQAESELSVFEVDLLEAKNKTSVGTEGTLTKLWWFDGWIAAWSHSWSSVRIHQSSSNKGKLVTGPNVGNEGRTDAAEQRRQRRLLTKVVLVLTETVLMMRLISWRSDRVPTLTRAHRKRLQQTPEPGVNHLSGLSRGPPMCYNERRLDLCSGS